MLGNRLEFVLCWFALSKLGAAHVPVNVDYRGDVPRAPGEHGPGEGHRAGGPLARDGGGLAPAPAAAAHPDRRGSGAAVAARDVDDARLRGRPARRRAARGEIGPSDIGAIMFTSGTTGARRARSAAREPPPALRAQRRAARHRARHVYRTELPLFHINAQMTVYGALSSAARARGSRSASRRRAGSSGSGRADATHTSMLGVMLEFVLAQPPIRRRPRPCAALGLDRPLRASDRRALSRALRHRAARDLVRHHRGRHGREPRGRARRAGSAGAVGPDFYEVAVADPETDEPVSAGEAGEILVRPRLPWTTTRGYFGMPDRTLAMRNLWFHTGDAGAPRRATATCASSTGSRTASGGAERTSPRQTSSTS